MLNLTKLHLYGAEKPAYAGNLGWCVGQFCVFFLNDN